MAVSIRVMDRSDREAWADMRAVLWPEDSAARHLAEIDEILATDGAWGFLAESPAGRPAGFVEISIRKYADGCTDRPVAFLEGIWTDPDHRRTGVGAALLGHIERFLPARSSARTPWRKTPCRGRRTAAGGSPRPKRWSISESRWMATGRDDGTLGPCPLCGRALIDGPSINRHHWVPRGHGGDGWSVLHVICHKKIHSVLTDRDLATDYATPEALRAHPEIAAFIRWVRRRPPEYMDRHDRRRR